ncbi:MAG: class I SAM-dependent methyltransferase [Lachnospiraceae bacterium]|nr:class I SAM-dependent methyltransferase [Lachnospiraceae bacterium]MBP3610968.1 class I SAM-dependent methyltransferase [Lachnospiraceae bacterium]
MLIEEEVQGIPLVLHTNEEVFSPGAVDRGTRAMLSFVTFTEEDKVLDLGCGCGVVGICAARQTGADKVWMCDVSENAVALSEQNAKVNKVEGVHICRSDGLRQIEESGFTLILSNPPYHTDFSVAKEFIEDGFKRLAVGGRMIMVTKRLDWYRNKLTSVFGGVTVKELDGYYVFLAEKRGMRKPKKEKKNPQGMSKKLQRKYGK